MAGSYLYANADPANMVDPTGNFAALINFGTSLVRTAVAGASSAAGSVFGRAIAATFIAGKTVTGPLRREVATCRKTQGKKCRIPNLVVIGSDYLEAKEHIADAQAGRGSNGIPITPRLTYKKGANKDRNWLNKTTECKGKTGKGTGKDCDEYPFATTKQGGPKRYRSKQVSLRPIDSCCNRDSGRRIWGGATRGQKSGTKFLVVPYGPVSFYVVKGRYGVR